MLLLGIIQSSLEPVTVLLAIAIFITAKVLQPLFSFAILWKHQNEFS